MALGVQVVVPIGWAMATYLFVQCYQALRNKTRWSGREIASNLANDAILIVLFVGANYLHFNLKGWVPLVNPALFDAAYMASDESLRPLIDAFTWASNTIRTNLNPELRWYQFMFLIMFILSFCRFAAIRDAYYPPFAVSMLLMTSLGALSYLIAPALGPFIYEDGNHNEHPYDYDGLMENPHVGRPFNTMRSRGSRGVSRFICHLAAGKRRWADNLAEK